MKNQWALISGATAGIGKATAVALTKQGWNLILLGRRSERLSTLETELGKNVSVKTFALDISNRAAVEKFGHDNAAVLKQVALLVNNAGLARGIAKLQDGELEDWDVMIDTNVKGLLYLTKQILPFMVQNKSGHIVNLGSVAGRWTYPGGGVYAATKFAVRALSEGIRLDTLGTGVRVTNIEPGMVETEFSEVRLLDKDKAKAVYKGMTPLKAEDIAECIAWCVARPAHVNIQELVIFPTDQASVQNVHRTTN